MKSTHRLAAAALWLAVAPSDPLPLAAGTALAYYSGGGSFSPDMDLSLGIGHRGKTHLLEIPLALGVLAAVMALPGLPLYWVPFSLAVGWGSHLLLDIFSGRRGIPSKILRCRLTVPDWLWIHTDGWFERMILFPVFLATAGALAALRVFLICLEVQ